MAMTVTLMVRVPGRTETHLKVAAEALDQERRTFYLRYYLSPRYVARTLRRRWRPLLANFGEEASFALRSTRFFLGGS